MWTTDFLPVPQQWQGMRQAHRTWLWKHPGQKEILNRLFSKWWNTSNADSQACRGASPCHCSDPGKCWRALEYIRTILLTFSFSLVAWNDFTYVAKPLEALWV
jgi:hypothetical protein